MPLTLVCPDEGTDQQPHLTDAAVESESSDATAALAVLETPDEATPDAVEATEAPEVMQAEQQAEPSEEQPVELKAAETQQLAAEQPTSEPTPPATAKPKPDARGEYLRKKSSYEESIAAISIELVKLAENQKHLKKERDVLTENLSDLIDDWERGPEEDVTPAVDEHATDEQPVDVESTQTAEAPQAEQPSQKQSQGQPDEQARYEKALRAATVDQLGLPPKVTERLAEAGATDVWRLEQLRAEISQGREKWPKGIGESKVTQIEDALMNWLSRNVSAWQTPEAEPEAGPEAKAETASEPKPQAACSVDDL